MPSTDTRTVKVFRYHFANGLHLNEDARGQGPGGGNFTEAEAVEALKSVLIIPGGPGKPPMIPAIFTVVEMGSGRTSVVFTDQVVRVELVLEEEDLDRGTSPELMNRGKIPAGRGRHA